MTREWTRDKWSCSNWCAYCADGSTYEERKRRLEEECPEHHRAQVLIHVKSVHWLKRNAKRKDSDPSPYN